MGKKLTFEADDIGAFKALMTKAGFLQHEVALLAGHNNVDPLILWTDLRKLVTGQSNLVDTAHILPPVDGAGSSTVARRGDTLWHDGRRLGVLRCSELKDVQTYAELAAYFKPEAHPPADVLKLLADNPRFIPVDWNLHGQTESWVIFMSTRDNDRVSGLSNSSTMHQGWWAAGDNDGLEDTDRVVVYEDAI